MPLASRHETALRGLTSKQFRELRDRVAAAFSLRPRHRTADDLIKFCRQPTHHPADLAAPFFASTDELGLGILEALMGHKITRAVHVGGTAPKSSRKGRVPRPLEDNGVARAARASSASSRRAMVISIHVEGNPHAAGSGNAHVRWMYYREGASVAEYVERGGQMSDVKFHERKGWISLHSAEDYAAARERERRRAAKKAA